MKQIALLLIICITGAQASLVATELETVNVNLDAQSSFVWLRDSSNEPGLKISLTAQHMVLERWNQSYDAVVVADSPLDGNSYIVGSPYFVEDGWAPVETYENVRANSTLLQSRVGMAIAVAGVMDIQADLQHVLMDSLENPTFDYVYGVSDGDGIDFGYETFQSRSFSESKLLTESNAGAIDVAIAGDVVIEMERIDFDAQTNQGPISIETRFDGDYSQTGVTKAVERFARLTLKGASLTISSDFFNGELQQIHDSITLDARQAIQLRNATGSLNGLDLQNQDAMIPAGHFEAVPSGAQFALDDGKKDTQSLGFMAAGAPHLLWLLTPLLLLPFMRRRATLDRMESAIAGGKFHKASKVAMRLLKKSPYEERATMGYVVAQAKMGLHNNVVNHLQRWFKSQKPTDGVFNYVLGMSYMELGEAEVAANQFAAAVKLTPSLKEEIPSVPVVAEHAYA